MLYKLYLVIGLITMAFAENKPFYDLEGAEKLFENFISTYNKTYEHQFEKRQRFEIFKANLNKINDLNSKYEAVFDINKSADLTEEELRTRYMGYKKGFTDACTVIKDIKSQDAPDSLNWLEKGAVTPVKDQGDCASCWAVSTVGNIEGQYFLKYNQLQTFSPQQLLDCSDRNYGCVGGYMTYAMLDLIKLGGLEMESTYPYKGVKQSCEFNKTKAVAKLSGCNLYDFLGKDEDLVKEILAKKGPISIGVNGGAVELYKKGILTASSCPPKLLSHAVLLVGYGTDAGVDYWLVKDSRGPTWGENGYFRMKRGENTCGFLCDYLYQSVIE